MAAHSIQNAHTLSQLSKTMKDNSNKYSFDEEFMDKVMKQQEAIRKSGMINMFDVGGVQKIASDMDSSELVAFIEQSSNDEYLKMAEESARRFR